MSRNFKRFKLVFGTFVTDDLPINLRSEPYDSLFERVIGADILETARQIAEAMLGEEVYAHESLGSVISVQETDEPYSFVSWNVQGTLLRMLPMLSKVSNIAMSPVSRDRVDFFKVALQQ